MISKFEDIVTHPVTVVSAALTSVSHLFAVPFLDAMLAVVYANLSTLFTASSVGAFTIVPRLPVPAWIGETAQVTAILLGLGYAGKLVYGVAKDAQERL